MRCREGVGVKSGKAALGFAIGLAWVSANAEGSESTEFAKARASFSTKLTREGPAPQDGEPLRAPPGSIALKYGASSQLTAFISKPKEGTRAPIVVFLHGGFAWGRSDWDMAAPYRDAGFLTVTPVLRGESGQPGAFTFYYDEVDDLVDLIDRVVRTGGVDPSAIFIVGHSAGGTLALLTSQVSPRVRAAVSFGGSPDQRTFIRAYAGIAPFDVANEQELSMRSPDQFVSSFRAPTRAYFGHDDDFFRKPTLAMAARARAAGRDVEAIEVPGDHFSSVPEAMRRSIGFFRAQLSAAP